MSVMRLRRHHHYSLLFRNITADFFTNSSFSCSRVKKSDQKVKISWVWQEWAHNSNITNRLLKSSIGLFHILRILLIFPLKDSLFPPSCNKLLFLIRKLRFKIDFTILFIINHQISCDKLQETSSCVIE